MRRSSGSLELRPARRRPFGLPAPAERKANGGARRTASDMVPSVIECRTMTGPERVDAYTLMRQFRSDEAALGDALALFVDRPDYGFVWLAYADGIPVACVSASFGISTETGGLFAELR